MAATVLLSPIALHKIQAWRAAQPAPIPATREQQQGIVAALANPTEIAELDLPVQLPTGQEPWLVVPDRTTMPCNYGSHASLEDSCKGFGFWLQSNNPQFSRKLRRDLIAANRKSVPLEQPKSSQLHMVPGDTPRPRTEEPAWWRNLYTRYPEADGLLRFSRATLSEDRQTALILVTADCSSEMGMGALIRLQRISGKWKPDLRHAAGWFAPLPAATEVSEDAWIQDRTVLVFRPMCQYPPEKRQERRIWQPA